MISRYGIEDTFEFLNLDVVEVLMLLHDDGLFELPEFAKEDWNEIYTSDDDLV